MIKKIIVCGVCGLEQAEDAPDAGWKGWGQLNGIGLDGIANPHLCPQHLIVAAEAIGDAQDMLNGKIEMKHKQVNR